MTYMYLRKLVRFASLGMAFGLALTSAHLAYSQTVLPLATEPLFKTRELPPNLILNLSVEFPTTGGAYRAVTTFVPSDTYVGYFNPDRCYTYNAAAGYFVPSVQTGGANRTCAGQFSGNFMNWATMSSIDILRYALSGGNRVVDTATTTVLERTILRNTTIGNVLINNYFPRKTITTAGNYTPYNPGTLRIVNCAGRVYFGDGTGGNITNCDTPNGDGNLSGAMNVRVLVCDATEGPFRKSIPDTAAPINAVLPVPPENRYCGQYGTNFKPEGELQRNSLGVRVGVFGYANIDDQKQYGGVLRAPAKFVGAKRVDAALNESDNPNKEWDEKTGIFINQPDPAGPFQYSGVINYLNRFGSLTNGQYKTYDPVGELYYESLRYLANIGPGLFPGDITRIGAPGVANAAYDGFPIYNTWTDPVLASCQANFAVTIGDTNTWWDRSLPGGVSNDANNDITRAAPDAMGLDARAETQRLFTDLGAGVTGGLGVDDTTGVGNAGRYFAGAAYWAHTNGFRPRNDGSGSRQMLTSYFIDVQEGSGIQYRQRAGYLAAIGGAFNDVNNNKRADATEWPYASGVAAASNITAEGQTFVLPAGFYLGGQPRSLLLGIKDIFAKITSQSGNIANLPLSAPIFNPNDTSFYQTGLDAKQWSGQVFKYFLRQPTPGSPSLVRANSGTGPIVDAPAWEAAGLLNARTAASRTIYAGVSVAPTVPATTAVGRWVGATALSLGNLAASFNSLSQSQRNALNLNPISGNADNVGRDRLAFLLGDRTTEIGQNCTTCLTPGPGALRVRDGVMGDVVNSGALFVGKPGLSSRDADYRAFATQPAVVNRRPMVYVGANDGMLHAFDANTGQERFAYIPNAVFGSLNQLTNPSYVHRPYVDGPMLVAEAKTTTGASTGWKTILTSSFGVGAQGLMALDVTNPDSFGPGNIIWEFTDKDDPDIGYITSVPRVVKLARGTGFEYFVAVSSGYNNYAPDGTTTTATNGDGFVYLLSLNKQPSDAWNCTTTPNTGANCIKFRLPISDNGLANGIGGIAIDRDDADQVKSIYAGDLQGNLWKVEFPSSDPAQWKVAFDGAPLATFRDNANVRQPISAEPALLFGPNNTIVVVVGTGRLLTISDTSAPFQQQSVYGIWDVGDQRVNAPSARSRLAQRTVLVNAGVGTRAVGFTAAGAQELDFAFGTTGAGKQGWYYDASSIGERAVFGGSALRTTLFLNSLIPSTSACGSGSSWTCPLDGVYGRTKGGKSCELVDQLIGKPQPLALPASLDGVTSTGLARGSSQLVNLYSKAALNKSENQGALIGVSTGGSGPGSDRDGEPGWRNLNWREIVNWQQLRNNPSKAITP